MPTQATRLSLRHGQVTVCDDSWGGGRSYPALNLSGLLHSSPWEVSAVFSQLPTPQQGLLRGGARSSGLTEAQQGQDGWALLPPPWGAFLSVADVFPIQLGLSLVATRWP